MRLQRLDLIRYGRFTDSELELPTGEPDLHIVVGPNEAGKSTVRSAVGDLLFGIPSRSPLNFVHEYGSMRIGAALEIAGEVLEVRRRKGNRDTLLAADDTRIPSGEQALRPFLHGADRSFFERMFSLDHLRLREGGREILQGDADDAGQKLFAAGSGIQGLQRRLQGLDDDASGLWTNRRAGTRKYYIAEDKLKAAESLRREHTVSADRWRELRRAYEASEQEHDRLKDQIEEAGRELRRVARIRRIARHVDKKSSLDNEIECLGTVAEIPEGSAERLRDAEEECRKASLLLERAGSELDKAKADRASIEWDDALLRRKGEIESLHQQRIQVKKGIADLPGLKRKLGEQQRTLVSIAADCGWNRLDADSIAERIPHRSQLETARNLLAEWNKQRTRVEAALKSTDEALSRLDEIRSELDAVGTPRDVSDLAALIAATKREYGGIGPQVERAHDEAQKAKAETDRLSSELAPRLDSVEFALALATPSKRQVQDFRDRRRDLDQRLHACREQLASERNDLASAEESVNQLVAEGEPVTLGDVIEARESRNAIWTTLRKRFIEEGGLDGVDGIELGAEPQQMADRYQDAVAKADHLGDLRSDMAESTAKVAEARRRVGAVRSDLAGTTTELKRLEEQDRQIVSEWNGLWKALAVQPLDPDQMLAWLNTRDSLSDAVAEAAKSDRRLAALRDQEAESVRALAEELEGLGEDCSRLHQQRLATVLERAGAVLAKNERINESRTRLDNDLRRATNDANAKRSLLDSAEAQLERLGREWAALADKIAIDPTMSPRDADNLLGTFDKMREAARRIGDLRSDRIEKIERDIGHFSAEVETLAAAVAPDLVRRDPSEATVELEGRLGNAEAARAAAQGKDKEIQDLEKRVGELKAGQQESERVIRDLQAQAGVSDVKDLWIEIKKAEKHNSLRKLVADLTETILQDGDDLPLAELVAECSGTDLDELAHREQSLKSSTDEWHQSFLAARDQLRDAREAFKSVGGSDAAAIAESARQSALAEIQEVAEQFIQVRAAACLLRWAIERYRSERQGPMLRRAGELFAILTLDSFDHLELDFDEQDQAKIVGCRQSGERVPTSGMSDGSADQLYLALRMAALEDYLDQSPQLPFLADDLFINFDDQRSAAGFKVLASLAQRCQVIFFTHHDHLAELALQSLDCPVRVVRIER